MINNGSENGSSIDKYHVVRPLNFQYLLLRLNISAISQYQHPFSQYFEPQDFFVQAGLLIKILNN